MCQVDCDFRSRANIYNNEIKTKSKRYNTHVVFYLSTINIWHFCKSSYDNDELLSDAKSMHLSKYKLIY